MAPAGISAFEARRRENVANNAKLLQESQALGAKMAKAAKPPPRPVTTRKRKPAEPVQRTRIMPTRQSARLSGGAGGDVELESLKTAAEIIQDQRPAKRSRVTEDLNLSKVALEGSRWTNGDALASFAQGAEPGKRTFTDEDMKDTKDEKLLELRKGMAELELYDGWLPNGKICRILLRTTVLPRWFLLLIECRHQNNARADICIVVSPNPRQTHCLCRRQEGRHGCL